MLTFQVGMEIKIQSHHDGFNMPDPFLGFPSRWLLEIGRQQYPKEVNDAEAIANKAYPLFCVLKDLFLEKGYDKELAFQVASEKTLERFDKYQLPHNPITYPIPEQYLYRARLILFEATIGFEEEADFRPHSTRYTLQDIRTTSDIELVYQSFGKKLEAKGMPSVKLQKTSDIPLINEMLRKHGEDIQRERLAKRQILDTMRQIADQQLKDLKE